jgi:dolichyl-phosphate beta-glucosyltransferase
MEKKIAMKILLIIPCYNEESRLKLTDFEEGRKLNLFAGIQLSYLFADDGSRDRTHEILNSHCKNTQGDFVFTAPENLGKANVVQAAYHSIKSENYDWIGYWDADLATPLAEIPRMIKFLEFYPTQSVSSIWGSRISRLGSDIKRHLHRHYLGRIFVTLVSNVLDVKAYDSQCGAKLFTPGAAKLAFIEPFISRWIFDVEILLRLKELQIIEYPLLTWEDVPGSKVKVFKEIFRVGLDLLKIRKKYIC